ncbi:MAG: zinc ribbon domain-containing protein [bacterium]|nr:zinc ribbon domain-containing protein [bacterium]
MPLYTVKNKVTGETESLICPYEDLKLLLSENPDLQQSLAAPRTVSGIKDVRARIPDGFKDVLRKVKQGSGKQNTIGI